MEIFFRCVIFFLVLFIIIKLLGKKQIKHMTLYDYVVGITIGSIAADSIISLEIPLWDGIMAVIFFGGLGYLVSMISFYFHETEKYIDGKPILLFEKDHFIKENLKKAKISPTQLLENCRLKGCFDLKELDSALLEPSGEVSILLKTTSQNLSTKDLKSSVTKKSTKQTLCYTIISDGVLDERELKKAKKNMNWLQKYLKKEHKKIEDVLLFTIDQYGNPSLY